MLLDVKNLRICFSSGNRRTEAVKDISFSLDSGKILAVVGESGSGKSVSALALTRLLPASPACELAGEINFDGTDILRMSARELQKIRGKEIAYIFQEPGTSLNPVYTVGFQIGEVIRAHFPKTKNVRAEIIRALEEVGIRDAGERADAYPHELSGGMQQRVMIAMALAGRPRVLVADEPTTALDVTIQKQIMELLAAMRVKYGMSILMITHNFGVVANFADDIAVMYRGEIVERGVAGDVLMYPKHEYTKALIACIPRVGQRRGRLETIGA